MEVCLKVEKQAKEILIEESNKSITHYLN